MTKHYFAADGNYGDAEALTIIDTTDWTPEEWEELENVHESDRAAMAASIARCK